MARTQSHKARSKAPRHVPNTGIVETEGKSKLADSDALPGEVPPDTGEGDALDNRMVGEQQPAAAQTNDGPAPDIVHEPSHQPGTPGFVERRRDPQARRAADVAARTQPVDIAKVAPAVEALVRTTLTKALHRVLPQALRLVAEGSTNDPALAQAATEALAGNPKLPTVPGDKPVVEVRNGVRCPDYGTVTGRLWLLYAKIGAGCTLAQAKEQARVNGMSETSAAIALYNWRKFHGVPSPRNVVTH